MAAEFNFSPMSGLIYGGERIGGRFVYIKHLAQGYDRDWVLRDLIETFENPRSL